MVLLFKLKRNALLLFFIATMPNTTMYCMDIEYKKIKKSPALWGINRINHFENFIKINKKNPETESSEDQIEILVEKLSKTLPRRNYKKTSLAKLIKKKAKDVFLRASNKSLAQNVNILKIKGNNFVKQKIIVWQGKKSGILTIRKNIPDEYINIIKRDNFLDISISKKFIKTLNKSIKTEIIHIIFLKKLNELEINGPTKFLGYNIHGNQSMDFYKNFKISLKKGAKAILSGQKDRDSLDFEQIVLEIDETSNFNAQNLLANQSVVVLTDFSPDGPIASVNICSVLETNIVDAKRETLFSPDINLAEYIYFCRSTRKFLWEN